MGRPQLARALVAAGHVRSVQEAFDKFLATGQPAFVPRTGPSPADVVHVVHRVGGVASMAHPAVTKRDELIAPLVAEGLDAIEVYHSDHTPEDEQAYLKMAARLGVEMTGGSDFHGEDPGVPQGRPRRAMLGAIALPRAAFARLEAKARDRQITR